MFLEGDESGVCVIDKDPWVLVMVGAPGVPIGLLRYEAREIAEAFPMGQQPQPVEQATDVEAAEDLAAPAAPDVNEQSAPSEHEAAADAGEQAPDLLTDDQQWWSVPAAHAAADPEPEIRWADEPTRDQPAGEDEPDVPATDWDWVAGVAPVEPVAPATPAEEPVSLDFTAAAGPMVFDMGPEPSAFDIPGFEAAPAPLVFDMPPVDESTPGYQGAAAAVPPGFGVPDYADAQFGGQSVPEVRRGAAPDLAQLAPPTGPAIELPAPRGPAFQLPPPA